MIRLSPVAVAPLLASVTIKWQIAISLVGCVLPCRNRWLQRHSARIFLSWANSIRPSWCQSLFSYLLLDLTSFLYHLWRQGKITKYQVVVVNSVHSMNSVYSESLTKVKKKVKKGTTHAVNSSVVRIHTRIFRLQKFIWKFHTPKN